MIYQGLAAMSRRDAWSEAPPGERRRLMTSELQDANSRSRLLSLVVDDARLRDFEQPVTARMEYQIHRHFNGEATREGSLTDSLVWNRLLAYTLDPERRAPLDLWTPFESIHRYVVQLPIAMRLDDVPKRQEVASRWGSFRLEVGHDPDEPRKLELTFNTRLENVRIERADFAAFQKFHEEVNKHWRVWIYLKPTQDLADAPALEVLLALAPGADSSSALALAKLYQHHDKLADARRVLSSARVHHPHDAALWELAVKLAQSATEEEKIYTEMVQRFPGEPKYAVALGAARVSRGDDQKAQKTLEPLTSHSSGSVRASALYHLARSAFNQKQALAALKYLDAARLADAGTVSGVAALQFKAQVQQQLGQRQAAIETYGEALQIEPDSREVLAAVVDLELAEDRRLDALDHLRRYTVVVGRSADSSDVLDLVRAAEFHLRMDRLEDASELAGRAR
jgi:tetratricopeptide (TPR) repeat protein